ncbi:peptidase S8/S53 domain-containing protein [Halteromyces radiatus]|uniref:peptidase S8/S53 domain-containing protein n=1 Tax=Halteromyces radiatus TaxID=101107 RepID=UPI00222103CB|nr:peptidase S8/S53 domain-containing protein [Halteromyces radiatus]KAI8076860.1 peptidase S8/S53 domain-containing protein [Halteromyces radiatus]
MKFSIITGALLLAGYATAVPMVPVQSFSEGQVSPLYTPDFVDTVLDSYIVILKDNIHIDKVNEHKSWVDKLTAASNQGSQWLNPTTGSHGVRHVYDMPNLKGYSGKFDTTTLNAIRSSEDVAYVERDSIVYASELQRSAPWGLARIAHRNGLTLSTFSKYNYATDGGNGVKVYVIDTGINVEHVDFEGRATWGKTIPLGDPDVDGNGHGSHCAGTIAGKKYGVAKQAQPVAVKVLRSNGSGSMTDVLKGVDWATAAHLKDAKEAVNNGKTYKGAVANMSLGGGRSRSLERAVDNAVDSGIIFAVAAGNDNKDSCNYSPAASQKAITVGASTLLDSRAYFSNIGKCVDVFAPGKDIESVWIGSKEATNIISGTSMASPHVAGLAAYLLSLEEKSQVSPQDIKNKVLALATKDVLTDVGRESPNLLIYNGFDSTK